VGWASPTHTRIRSLEPAVTFLSRTLVAATAVSLLPGLALAQDVIDDDPPEGTPITGNELEVTGRTMEKGKHLVSVFGRYRYGVTDWFQAGSNGLEWIAGPNVNVGFSPYADDKHSVSLEVDSAASYSFDTTTVTANLIYSYGDKTGSRINAGIAYGLQNIAAVVQPKSNDPSFPDPPALDLTTKITALPLHFGYDWAFNDVQMLRIWFSPYVIYQIDPEAEYAAPFVFSSGVAYVRAYEKVRIIAGVAPTNAGVEQLRELEALALEWDADIPSVWDVLPMPYFRLYWHF